LESTTALAALMDECGQDEFTLETYEAILRRLSLAQGRILGTTTLYNTGWLKNEVFDRWEKGDPLYEVVQCSSVINPAFPREEFERAKSVMQSHRFKMQYLGQFDKPPGLIYDCVDDQHFEPPFEIPPEWPRYVGLDFGAVNTATVWGALDPDKNIYHIYRESLQGGMSTPEHVRWCKDVSAKENVVTTWGGAPSEDQPRMDWGANGWYVYRPPVADVEAGIDRVTRLFKERRVRIFNTLSGLRDELGSYRRKSDKMGMTIDEIENKRMFHRLDAFRYLASGINGDGNGWIAYATKKLKEAEANG